MPRSFETKAVRALERSSSLRATVPEAVAALLGLEAGDTVVWTVEPGTGRVTVSRKSTKNSPKRD